MRPDITDSEVQNIFSVTEATLTELEALHGHTIFKG